MRTVATRTDYAISSTASAYLYDTLGHLTDATSPGVTGSAHATFAWRLDGLLANRGYSTGAATLVYAYDGAKRAIAECNGSGGACSGGQVYVDIERTYDRVGDVMSETQTISGANPDTNGTQSFTYDAMRRVKTSSLGSIAKAYTYDADSNRLTVALGGVTTDVFSFDATDQTIADNATNFAYDRYGNLTSSGTSSVTATTYAYDLADRLNSITQADSSVVGFSFDAAGRHATRTGTAGATIDTYSYLGTSSSVIRDVSSSGTGYTLVSAIDSAGESGVTPTRPTTCSAARRTESSTRVRALARHGSPGPPHTTFQVHRLRSPMGTSSGARTTTVSGSPRANHIHHRHFTSDRGLFSLSSLNCRS